MTDLTLEQLQAARARLLQIRGKGVSSYQIGDRRMEFKSDVELNAALADIERRIAALTSTPVSTVVVTSSKGV